jgi:hypothetical protein
MSLRRTIVVLPFLLFVLSRPASAYVGPPYISPAEPTANEAISVNMYGDECDVVDDGIVWPPPVTQSGNVITISFTGIHEEDPEFCYFGVGTGTYPVGTFPAGSYTLKVERRYGTPFGTWAHETLGIIPFTVTGAPAAQPISAPTLSKAGLATLLLVMFGAALRAMRRRARPHC